MPTFSSTIAHPKKRFRCFVISGAQSALDFAARENGLTIVVSNTNFLLDVLTELSN
jgi:hypothetical protein